MVRLQKEMNLSGKQKNFLDLLDQYKPQIYRICYGFANQEASVDDLFQESMMRIWASMDKHRNDSKLSTWAYRITMNTCIYWQKKNKRKIVFTKELNQTPRSNTSIVNEHKSKSENIVLLKNAIDQLNKIDRSIILLVLEECSYKEISEITGMTVSNVGAKINRIKNRLKIIMQKENN